MCTLMSLSQRRLLKRCVCSPGRTWLCAGAHGPISHTKGFSLELWGHPSPGDTGGDQGTLLGLILGSKNARRFTLKTEEPPRGVLSAQPPPPWPWGCRTHPPITPQSPKFEGKKILSWLSTLFCYDSKHTVPYTATMSGSSLALADLCVSQRQSGDSPIIGAEILCVCGKRGRVALSFNVKTQSNCWVASNLPSKQALRPCCNDISCNSSLKSGF